MRDLRTFTYLFRLSVKAFGLFVTYVTMCLNLFWIRLKLFFITCSQIILDARQLIRLKNLETRTGLLHHPAFLPVKSNDKSKISPLVNQHCSVFSVSMDGDLGFVFPMKILKISISVHPCFVSGDYVSFGFIISEW